MPSGASNWRCTASAYGRPVEAFNHQSEQIGTEIRIVEDGMRFEREMFIPEFIQQFGQRLA